MMLLPLYTLLQLFRWRQFLGILTVLLVFTAVLCAFDKDHFSGIEDEESIWDRIFNRAYFVCTTVSTAGYGDIYAKSKGARGVVLVLLVLIMTEYTSKLTEALKSK